MIEVLFFVLSGIDADLNMTAILLVVEVNETFFASDKDLTWNEFRGLLTFIQPDD